MYATFENEQEAETKVEYGRYKWYQNKKYFLTTSLCTFMGVSQLSTERKIMYQ